MQIHNMVIILISIFIIYRVYLRVRRTIGWQQMNPRKMRIWLVVFSIIGLLFLVQGVFHVDTLISDLAGILIGVIVAYYGTILTHIEQRDGHWYYRPNNWVGSLVTFLFIGRIIYRLYDMYMQSSQGGLANMGFNANSSWTSGLLLIMFAYYFVYYLNLLRKQRHLSQVNPSILQSKS